VISNRTARRQKQHHDMLYGIGHDMKRGGDEKKPKDNNPIHQEHWKYTKRLSQERMPTKRTIYTAEGKKKTSREPKMRY